MKLHEIATSKVDPKLQQVEWKPTKEGIFKTLQQSGYTDANIMKVLSIVNADAVVNHLKSNNITISEKVTIYILQKVGHLEKIIHDLPITDSVLLKVASLKGVSFEKIVSLIPNMSDDVLITAMHTKPSRAKTIRHIVHNISPKLAEVIRFYGHQVDARKINANLDVDINKWDAKQIIAYFKKLPVASVNVMFNQLKNPTEAISKVVVQKDGELIKYLNAEQQTPIVQLTAIKQYAMAIKYIHNPTVEAQKISVDNLSSTIKFIKNPDRSIIIKAFTKNPTLLHSLYSAHLSGTATYENLFNPDIIKEVLTTSHIYSHIFAASNIIEFIKMYFKDNTLLMNKWIRYAEQQTR